MLGWARKPSFCLALGAQAAVLAPASRTAPFFFCLFFFFACNRKHGEQPPVLGSLCAGAVRSRCQENEGWVAAWGVIRPGRSRN